MSCDPWWGSPLESVFDRELEPCIHDHAGMIPIRADEAVQCWHCQTLVATEVCEACGGEYLPKQANCCGVYLLDGSPVEPDHDPSPPTP